MQQNKYEIRNQNKSTAELLLYGIIGDYWDDLDAKDIVEAIRKIEAKEIVVRIYSDGGSVFAGLAIYNALKAHPANIVIKIDSLAASIASVIAMAGTVEMPENAFMMIHNPWGSVYGGESSDMERMAKLLVQIKSSLVTVYHSKTGLEDSKISSLMDEETWLMAKEAVELGFADTITGAAKADPKNMAIFNQLQNYKNVPEQLKNLLGEIKPAGESPAKAQEGENMTEKNEAPVVTLDFLRAEHPDIIESIATEARKAGAHAELERIKGVAGQSMPGHEDLINSLMYDGNTTGPEAAVAVLAAEKNLRAQKKEDLKADGIDPVPAALPGDGETVVDKNLPVEEQAKLVWDADKSLRNEFVNDFEAFKAYFENDSKGRSELLKSKKGDK